MYFYILLKILVSFNSSLDQQKKQRSTLLIFVQSDSLLSGLISNKVLIDLW